MKTIADVAAFLNVAPDRTIKTLVYASAAGDLAMALLRGDHELNELKLKNHLGWDEIQMATEEQVFACTGSPVGFLGPIGLIKSIPVIADRVVQGMTGAVLGANEKDLHYINADCGRDFAVTGFVDIRTVAAGDACPRCAAELAMAILSLIHGSLDGSGRQKDGWIFANEFMLVGGGGGLTRAWS